MIRIIIIEDEPAALKRLRQLLKEEYNGKLDFIGNADTVDSGIQLIKEQQPDLIFLDVQLKDGISFEILDHFTNSVNFEVIFISGFVDYKEKAMEYFAFYFLSKPVQKEKLKKVVDKYLAKRSAFDLEKYLIFKNQIAFEKKTIALPSHSGTFNIVNLEDLIYCEADGSYTNYYTTDNKKYVSSNNLKKVEGLLGDSSFYRIHRSTLLNLKHIKKYNTNGRIVLSNSKTLTVSERNKKGFFKILKLFNYTID